MVFRLKLPPVMNDTGSFTGLLSRITMHGVDTLPFVGTTHGIDCKPHPKFSFQLPVTNAREVPARTVFEVDESTSDAFRIS